MNAEEENSFPEAGPVAAPARRVPLWPLIPLLLALPPLAVSLGAGLRLLLAALLGEPGIAPGGETAGEFERSPAGLVTLLLPSQIALLALAGLGLWLWRLPWRAGLGLGPGRVSPWTAGTLAVGSLFLQLPSGMLLEWLDLGRGETLELLDRTLGPQRGAAALLALVLASVLPGVCEEGFFRGFLQRLLLSRWRPAWAIAAAGGAFALSHVDPVHVLAVLPLGLWLGFLAWRCGSLWPVVWAHVLHNAVAVVFAQLFFRAGGDPEAQARIGMAFLSVHAFALAALVSGLRRLAVAEPPGPPLR